MGLRLIWWLTVSWVCSGERAPDGEELGEAGALVLALCDDARPVRPRGRLRQLRHHPERHHPQSMRHHRRRQVIPSARPCRPLAATQNMLPT